MAVGNGFANMQNSDAQQRAQRRSPASSEMDDRNEGDDLYDPDVPIDRVEVPALSFSSLQSAMSMDELGLTDEPLDSTSYAASTGFSPRSEHEHGLDGDHQEETEHVSRVVDHQEEIEHGSRVVDTRGQGKMEGRFGDDDAVQPSELVNVDDEMQLAQHMESTTHEDRRFEDNRTSGNLDNDSAFMADGKRDSDQANNSTIPRQKTSPASAKQADEPDNPAISDSGFVPVRSSLSDSEHENGEDSGDDMAVECASPRVDCEDHPPPTSLIITEPTNASETTVHPVLVQPDASPPSDVSIEYAKPHCKTVPVYSARDIFPVVFESNDLSASSSQSKATARCQEHHPNEDGPGITDVLVRSPKNQRPRPLLERIDRLQRQLQDATRSHKTQLDVLETDRNILTKRNSRLRSQVASLMADLARTKAENARLQTENSFLTTKIPQLQAALRHETAQVDEKHAQSIQTHLEITQLRAKTQVLQNRNATNEGQVEKLAAELRSARKELRKKILTSQQSEEKAKKLESELVEIKTEHAHEILSWKNKHTAILQKLQREGTNKDHESSKALQQQLVELKVTNAKLIKAKKAAETRVLGLEQELQLAKRDLTVMEQGLEHQAREVRELEVALDRAERTEVTLRQELTRLRLEARAWNREKKQLLQSRRPNQSMYDRETRKCASRGYRHSPPVPISASEPRDPVDLDDDTDSPARLCRCCARLLDEDLHSDAIESSTTSAWESPLMLLEGSPDPSGCCNKCEAIEGELRSAQEELTRVRELHVTELKVQASAYERVLATFRAPPQDSSSCA